MNDEPQLTAEERLKQLNQERKELRDKVVTERKQRLEKAAKDREARDIEIERTRKTLDKIQSEIYSYNKLGKCAKIEYDILGIILKEINSEAEEEVIADSA